MESLYGRKVKQIEIGMGSSVPTLAPQKAKNE
jgi:hypothetical protein